MFTSDKTVYVEFPVLYEELFLKRMCKALTDFLFGRESPKALPIAQVIAREHARYSSYQESKRQASILLSELREHKVFASVNTFQLSANEAKYTVSIYASVQGVENPIQVYEVDEYDAFQHPRCLELAISNSIAQYESAFKPF